MAKIHDRDERRYGKTAERKAHGRTARRANDDAFIGEGVSDLTSEGMGVCIHDVALESYCPDCSYCKFERES